MHYIFSDFIKT